MVITKFRVANEEGVAELSELTKALALEKFEDLLPKEMLTSYISDNFNDKTLVDEMNSLSNQWLVVYKDDQAAGYVRITSKGKRPESLENKRAIRIADFGILKAHSEAAVWQSLFDKCLSVGRGYEAIWLNEYKESPVLDFFEKGGFSKKEQVTELDELPVPAVYLVREA